MATPRKRRPLAKSTGTGKAGTKAAATRARPGGSALGPSAPREVHAAWQELRLPRGAVVSRSNASELVAKLPFLSTAAAKGVRYARADAEKVMNGYMSLLEREHGWIAAESKDSWDDPAWIFIKHGEPRSLFVCVAAGRSALELNLVWNASDG